MEDQPEKPARSPLRKSVERFMLLGAAIGLLAGLSIVAPSFQQGEDPARLAGRVFFYVLLGGSVGALVGYIRFKIRGGSDSEV